MKWYQVLDRLAENDGFRKAGVTRILLAGVPGTGKSSWPNHQMTGRSIERVHLTEDSGPEDLLGVYTLADSSTRFVKGPAALAMSKGRVLVIDEIDRSSRSVESILFGILDDPDIAKIQLPTGHSVTPTDGYMVFATMNGNPGSLDEALLDRFDLILVCNEPHPEIIERLPNDVGPAVQRRYQSQPQEGFNWSAQLTVRTALAFVKLRDVLGPDEAAEAVWGEENAPEIVSVFASHGD